MLKRTPLHMEIFEQLIQHHGFMPTLAHLYRTSFRKPLKQDVPPCEHIRRPSLKENDTRQRETPAETKAGRAFAGFRPLVKNILSRFDEKANLCEEDAHHSYR